MRKYLYLLTLSVLILFFAACSAAYKANPLSFKAPGADPDAKKFAGAIVSAKAFADSKEAERAFGFNIRKAGMLPVQVVFDNQGVNFLEINTSQTFLEDKEGNLWPVLSEKLAYERATKYAETNEIFKEGAYYGFLGATAGAIIGGAVGIISGDDVGEAIGKGAAIGGASGSVIGGAKGYSKGEEARSAITSDLRNKSLKKKKIEPKSLAFGFVFFPGEAKSAKLLRLRIVDTNSDLSQTLILNF